MKSLTFRSKAVLGIVIFVLAIAMTWLATSLINNALAEEGEANACPEVTYSVLPDASFESYCIISTGTPAATDTSLICDFENDDKRRLEVKGNNSGTIVLKITVTELGLPEGYRFRGFYINDQQILTVKEITENSLIQVVFAFNSCSCSAIDQSSGSISRLADYTFSMYDKNQNLVEEKNTNTEGVCTFWNVDSNCLPCSILGHKEGYTDLLLCVTSDSFSPLPHTLVYGQVVPIENKTFSIQSKSDVHNYFKVHSEETELGDKKIFDAFISGINLYYPLSQLRYTDTITIKEDNTLFENFVKRASTSWTDNTYTPVPVEGRTFSHWLVDDGTGPRVAEPGESFTLTDEAGLSFEAVYDDAPQPGPEPEPTPAEEVNAAQTGDVINAILPLAILAAVSAAALIARRRIAQK